MAYNGNGNSFNRVSEWKIRQQMCDIGHRIWLKGFCAGNEGNHSYRIAPNRVLCTPTGISKGQLSADDICVVDMEGKQVAGKRKRTSEVMLHLAIYAQRDDVKAVIHSHPPHATAFAVAGVELPTCVHPEAEVFLGPVKTAQYVTPGDQRLGETIAPYVKDANTILLANHGSVTFAETLEDAYYKLEIVDAYARILLLAKQVGSINTLDPKQMKELIELKPKFGMSDPRLDDLDNLACSNDFLTRVGDQVAQRGMMMCGTGVVPTPGDGASTGTGAGGDAMTRAIGNAIGNADMSNATEEDFEQLVQMITDQIMASA